jgi:RHS repeat-associated protein
VLIYYVHTDHLNTPRRVTRPSDNKLMWSWYSDPFGTDLPNENPAAGGTFKYNLRFPGQLYDSHAGLSQNYFRDYDPAIGRYVESDPIGLTGGVNTYGYVGSNAGMLTDALGLRIDWGHWTFTNPRVLENFAGLNNEIVASGIPDDCFTLRVTGGDRFRDLANPIVHRSMTPPLQRGGEFRSTESSFGGEGRSGNRFRD